MNTSHTLEHLWLQLVNEFLQSPQRSAHTFDMGQLLEEMQQIDQQSYRQAPQRGTRSSGHGRHRWLQRPDTCVYDPLLTFSLRSCRSSRCGSVGALW